MKLIKARRTGEKRWSFQNFEQEDLLAGQVIFITTATKMHPSCAKKQALALALFIRRNTHCLPADYLLKHT